MAAGHPLAVSRRRSRGLGRGLGHRGNRGPGRVVPAILPGRPVLVLYLLQGDKLAAWLGLDGGHRPARNSGPPRLVPAFGALLFPAAKTRHSPPKLHVMSIKITSAILRDA
jgi:hypothetical protein